MKHCVCGREIQTVDRIEYHQISPEKVKLVQTCEDEFRRESESKGL